MNKNPPVRHSGTDEPIFRESAAKVFADIDLYPDDKCLELSGDLEKKYLLNHIECVWQNLGMIGEGLKAMRCQKQPSILDIGTSPLTFIYRDCLRDVHLFTIDLTSLLAGRCREAGIDHRVCNLLKDAIPLDDGQMDMVVFTEVLEHLSTGPGSVFAEIKRLLRPGGMLVFSVPNAARLKNRINALLGKPVLDPVYVVFKEDKAQHSQGDGVWVHGFGHVREYTMSEALDLVRHYGFEVQGARSVDSYITPPEGSSRVRRLASAICRIASFVIPNSRMINLVLAKRS